jgi:hypothetical protein
MLHKEVLRNSYSSTITVRIGKTRSQLARHTAQTGQTINAQRILVEKFLQTNKVALI